MIFSDHFETAPCDFFAAIRVYSFAVHKIRIGDTQNFRIVPVMYPQLPNSSLEDFPENSP